MRRCLPSSSLTSAHAGRARADSLDDVVVAGAPAQVALEPVADFALAGIRVGSTQIGRAHDHAGGTEPALQAVMLAERGLHRMELAAVGEPLDRRDLGAIGLDREHRAGLDRLAVDVHGARAALARIAADVGARETEGAAPGFEQPGGGRTLERMSLSIDLERDGGHGTSPLRSPSEIQGARAIDCFI